jgi:aldehyde:ferredoxin oxidoreductase
MNLGVFIPIIAVGGFFAWMISLSPLGKALAERLRHGPIPRGGTAEDQAELVEQVAELRREVAELAERVDFTERLLGQQRAGEQIGKPRA